jgi:hypothetical protein
MTNNTTLANGDSTGITVQQRGWGEGCQTGVAMLDPAVAAWCFVNS